MKKTIESMNYNVQEAANGKEGLEIALLHKPDLIISDVLMPVMDGFQFCREVKKDDKLNNIPFIFYTATYTDKKDEEFALSLGAEKYIVKPVEPDVFQTMLKHFFTEYEKGTFVAPKKVCEEEKEVFKLYSERLVNKLEKKMLDLEKSERKYRNLCENVNDLVFSLDVDGRFTAANCRTELFGYTPDNVIGKHFTEVLTPESREIAKNYFKKTKKAKCKKRDIYEVEIIKKDGGTAIAELSMSSIYEEGKFIGRYGIARDITKRRQAEEKLIENEEKFRTFMETASDLMNITDKDGNFTYVNDSMARALEYSKEELIGMHITQILTKGSLEKDFKPNWPIFLDNGKMNIETTLLTKNGNVIDCILKAVAIYDKDENFIGSRTVVNDITERKHAEDQIRRELKEKELLLREVHHRVKNNLQVISGLLMLQENEITTKEDALKGFAASQDRILAMAKAYELLLGSEYMSEVSIVKYIESLAEQLKHNYDIHHKVKISYSLDELAISIEILDRLGLVLNEIITNSIKYAFEGREAGNIHIELKETEKHVVIKISDDGIGMPEGIDISNPDTLGLSLVEMLTAQLQGTLKLDRTNGTSYTLKIPKESEE